MRRRRHHNNTGLTGIKRGRTYRQVAFMARRLGVGRMPRQRKPKLRPLTGVWIYMVAEEEVKSSTISFGILRVDVHRHINFAPDVWLASVPSLWGDARPLESKSLKNAQDEALTLLYRDIGPLARRLSELLGYTIQ